MHALQVNMTRPKAPHLHDDVLRLIIGWLNPQSLRDRTTLVRCLRASTSLLELSAPILWSTHAVLSNRTGIEGRPTGGRCDIGTVIGALEELNRSKERGTGGDARLRWRWRIYIGAVKSLRILPRGSEGTPFIMAASVAPWVGTLDELVLQVVDADMGDDRGDWQHWLEARWSSDEVPKALTLLDAGWCSAEAKRYACHKAVKELSLVNIRSRLLDKILAERQGELDAIRVAWLPMTTNQHVRIMEILRNYKLKNVGSLTTIELTSQGTMTDIPDGLPVTSLDVGMNVARPISFSMAAARGSLRTLRIRDSDVMVPWPTRWLVQLDVLRTITIDMPRIHQDALLRSMHGMRYLRSVTLNLRNANTTLVLQLQALADANPKLTELNLSGPCTEFDTGFDPVVKALPRLKTLQIELTGNTGRVSLPLGLRKLVLRGMALEVDCSLVESEGLPDLEYARLIGVTVEDASGACNNAYFVKILPKAPAEANAKDDILDKMQVVDAEPTLIYNHLSHRASRACKACQEAHLVCDDQRPCSRCVKKDMASQCVDGQKKRAKYLEDNQPGSATADSSPHGGALPQHHRPQLPQQLPQDMATLSDPNGAGGPDFLRQGEHPDFADPLFRQKPDVPANPDAIQSNAASGQLIETNGHHGLHHNHHHQQQQLQQHQHQQSQQQHQQQSQQQPPIPTFGSEVVNLEYSFLSNLLASVTSPDYMGELVHPTSSAQQQQHHQQQQQALLNHQQQPLSQQLGAQGDHGHHHGGHGHQHHHTSAHHQHAIGAHSPTILVGAAASEVYSKVTRPYDYREGFHYLVRYVKERMGMDDVLRICKALAQFRPSFMAQIMNLSEEDLLFMEKCFQRTVMEFDKLIGFSGTPTVVWRRTGEIALVGKEFSLLTQWPREKLLGTRTYIYELMDTSSVVEYWEKFSMIAFDNSQQSCTLSATLLSPTNLPVRCAFCFTIKRDIFDVPL
ncbi:Transcriptional regulator of nonfermentable carbon utilization, partial [Irineochytrium annulatum]